ncbi:hypothetical protein [Lederbergia citri]|uniref:Uncharacterized protein n=1 Tax=Lederbergia citri TaxID=2833580 RepID=A0A942TE47_9BACI|nr:hypothetical protein [Lederbergia citri]MBS4196301.1 hypothetical protein [Lederbergia citri]
MLKIYSKKMVSAIVASSLVFGLGAVVSAAPKDDGKQTGRTEQNVQTGAISFNDVTVPRYAKEIKLSGTVVMDGPQLVVDIPGATKTTVTKIADKKWKYEATVDVSAIEGDAEIKISAYTIYTNGKPAGSVHTSAPTAIQKIHVPYVISTVAENTEWTAYDRSANQFTLAYDEVENWSVGDPVITSKTMSVQGMDKEVKVLGTILKVPTAIQDFVFSQEDPKWDFDSNTNTYSATFNILITDSKGNVTTESVTKTGLTPGEVNAVSHSLTDGFGTITKTQEITVPAAPALPVVDVVAVKLSSLQLTLTEQNKEQFKVKASYTIHYSDGSSKNIENEQLGGTIKNPTSKNQTSSTEVFNIGGLVYNVTVTYVSTTKTYEVTAALKQK